MSDKDTQDIDYGQASIDWQKVKEKEAAAAAAAQKSFQDKLSGSLSGPATGLTLYGTQDEQQGAVQGLNFGQMLYGQGIADVGKEAADYSGMVKGRLDTDYAKADVARQEAGQRIGQANAKAGLSGIDTTGINEQARRRSAMDASAMNQDYKDKALALYGRNISSKQQGIAGQYMAGAGIGQARTPGPVPQYSSGISIICTELYAQGKISKYEHLRATAYGHKLSDETYIGYLTIAKPIVELMKKSDKFSNLFIGWSKSIAAQKPNLITKILLPICWMVGHVRKLKEEKTIRIS